MEKDFRLLSVLPVVLTCFPPMQATCVLVTDTVPVDSLKPTIHAARQDGMLNLYSRPEPLYKTPEAMAFQEYGRFGTEGSNGSVDISIPIHTITCRDLQIPISLHYSGNGIKVAEEASWVGLGWDLSVGGCVNYVAAGKFDSNVRSYKWKDYAELIDSNSNEVFQTQLDISDYGVMHDLLDDLGERDFYSVNLLGRSFLFFADPTDDRQQTYTVIGSEENLYSIGRSGVDGWCIKDVRGYVYEFSTVEYSVMDGAGRQRSAVYLSSVETPQGITAVFRYDTTNVKGLPQGYQWYDAQRKDFSGTFENGPSFVYGVPRYGSGCSYSNIEIQKPWLKSITTDNQTVTFELSDRTDYKGAKKVDYIRVSDLNGATVSLHHLNYGKFAHSTVGGSFPDINDHLVSDPRNGERLKLISLSNMAVDKTDSLTHVFTYNEKHPLPLKTSAAVDMWGYFNGEQNFTRNDHITDKRSLIPSLMDCTICYSPPVKLNGSFLSIQGACRFSDPERILSGTLSSITYPTGGKTEFTFEPHEFRSSPSYPLKKTGYTDINVSVEDNNYPADKYNPGPVSNKPTDVIQGFCRGYLTVTFAASSGKKLRDLQQAKASVTLQPMASPEYRKIHITLDSCSTADLESTYFKQTIPVALENVKYMLIASLPDQIAYGSGRVSATLECRDIYNPGESGGAGLRIATIDNYDRDGTLTGRKTFEYTNTNGETSGNIVNGNRATEYRVKYIEHLVLKKVFSKLEVSYYLREPFDVVRINSSPGGSPAMTGTLARGNVAYSRVVESDYDGSGKLLKRVIGNYNVSTTREVLPDMHLLSQFGGGELSKTTILNADGETVQTVEYEYADNKSASIKCNIAIEDQYYEYISEKNFNHPAPRYLVRVYPYNVFWRVLTGVRKKEYTSSGMIESLTSYSYNEGNHLISEECTETGDTGVKTSYKYSADYSTLPYTNMCKQEYFARGVPVETVTYEKRDGIFTESGKVRYNYVFNPGRADMLRLSSVQESVAGGSLTTRESYTYSDDGNLVGVRSDNTLKRSFLWSYGHTCPVAVIDGASYEEVSSWAGSQLVATLAAAKGPADGLLTQIRSALQDKNVAVTTYTYKPLVGITSATGPNGMRVSYSFDKFSRLASVSDHAASKLQTFSYDFRSAKGASLTSRTMLNAAGSNYTQSVSVHDGLGRLVQTVQTGLNTTGKPVVSFSELDPSGNQVRQWLPFAVSSGTDVSTSNVASLSAAFHSDNHAKSDMTYDLLGRLTYASTSGEAWHTASKGKSYTYGTNKAGSVCLYKADANGMGVTRSGHWAANSLSSRMTTDEDGLTVETFTDGAGRTVLERRGGDSDTYYVYNNAGQLRYVLQPMYAENQDASLYAFEYRYDTKGNLTYKKVPGAGPLTYSYDIGRRVTFMQDARLKERGLHRFFIYDGLGRVVIQGTAASCTVTESLNTATYTGGTTGFMQTGYTLAESSRIQQATLEIVNYYDDYRFADGLDSRLIQAATVSARGLSTGSVVYNSDGGKSMSAIYYDIRGNVTTLREITDFRTLRVTENTYNFTNQPLTTKMTESGGVTMLTENTYDTGSGLLVSTDVTVNGTKQRVSKVTYDDLGRISSVVRGNGANSGGTVTYAYNLHGQTTDINGPGLIQKINYTDGPGKPLYNGSVSSMQWAMGYGTTRRGYRYTYNKYNWLTLAEYGEGGSLSVNRNRYTEQFSSFTRNGSILSMQRHGLRSDGTYGKVDDLSITYYGNRISVVAESAAAVTQTGSMDFPGMGKKTFTYDSSGALVSDSGRGIESIEYDNFGNPVYFDLKGGDYTKNVYSASGMKLKTAHYTSPNIIVPPISLEASLSASEPDGAASVVGPLEPGTQLMAGMEELEYRGSVVYRNRKIDMVLFPGGYATVGTDKSVTFHYYTQDYLGNNRAVVNGSNGAIEQTTAYYPYGAVIPDISTDNTGQPFKYGGKELVSANGLNMYDFGARLHYPAIPQFDRVDPMSEKFAWLSPYLYCGNNPVNFIDPSGMVWKEAKEAEVLQKALEQKIANYKSLSWINKYLTLSHYKTLNQSV